MTANAGYHTYTTGDVLTAAQVQYNLQNQTVMYFATTGARTTALTGVSVEGMVSYVPSTGLQYYNGTTWVNVAGAASPLTTKGDVYGYDTAGARIPIGSNAQVLTADSTQALGLKWATPAAGGSMTLLSTTSLTGSSVVLSSISQSYRDLRLEIKDPTFSTNNSDILLRVNADTGTNYDSYQAYSQVGILNGYSGVGNETSFNVTRQFDMQNTSVDAAFMYRLYDYKDTTSIRLGDYIASFQKGATTAGDRILVAGQLYYKNVGTTISSITIAMSAGTFSTGTAYLYGVN